MPEAPASVITRHLATETDTMALGAALGRALVAGLVIYLSGDLGAGKTTLVRGMLRGCGYQGRVKSPTFSLVELYEISKLYLYHFDFYRLETPTGWLDAGFREYFDGHGVCVVEWPERAGTTLPAPDLRIALTFAPPGRDVTLTATTETGRRCLSAIGG